MAKVFGLHVGILTALALCKYCLAQVNATESPNGTVTHRHGNRDNCTDASDTGQWSGHFTTCPEELQDFCVHGDCRYVEQQKAPSCRCNHGYVGHRCEYVDLGLRIADRREIIVIGVIVGLLFFILFLVFLCICSRRRWRWCWQRTRRREEPRNGTEKHSLKEAGGGAGGGTGATHTSATLDSPTEPLHTNSV